MLLIARNLSFFIILGLHGIVRHGIASPPSALDIFLFILRHRIASLELLICSANSMRKENTTHDYKNVHPLV